MTLHPKSEFCTSDQECKNKCARVLRIFQRFRTTHTYMRGVAMRQCSYVKNMHGGVKTKSRLCSVGTNSLVVIETDSSSCCITNRRTGATKDLTKDCAPADARYTPPAAQAIYLSSDEAARSVAASGIACFTHTHTQAHTPTVHRRARCAVGANAEHGG